MVRNDDRDWIERRASLQPANALAEPVETGGAGPDEINLHVRRSRWGGPVAAGEDALQV